VRIINGYLSVPHGKRNMQMFPNLSPLFQSNSSCDTMGRVVTKIDDDGERLNAIQHFIRAKKQQAKQEAVSQKSSSLF
jgi:hypothetical protein